MKLFCTSVLLVCSLITRAQSSSQDDSLLIGTWKGTSICQVRPSPCNDEVSVYHITRNDRENSYHVVMNKVINDKEEDMAAYDYYFDVSSKTLSCWDEQHKIAWKFHLSGRRMEGTLVYQEKVYRIIKLMRVDSN